MPSYSSVWRLLRQTKRFAVDITLRTILFLRWHLRHVLPVHAHGLPASLVVSLTSYPKRFPTLHLTLMSLLTQSVRPDMVVLWVFDDEMKFIPENIRSLTKHGLSIKSCENLRSYCKIVPALRDYPDAFIITADDDVYYRRNWIRPLTQAYKGNGKEIICHRAHVIKLDGNGMPRAYSDWDFNIDREITSDHVFPTGTGGVLYPPHVFDSEVTDTKTFLDICPTADDIWLYFLARKAGAIWTKIGARQWFPKWEGSQESALNYINLHDGGNDRQMRNMLERYGFGQVRNVP